MFYVDVADMFYDKKTTKHKAVAILLNILELDFDNPEYMRIVAFKLIELKKYHLAVRVFQKIKELRPFEPQSYRDLALAQQYAGDYNRAVKNLYYILTHTWQDRFRGIKIVVLNELNQIITINKTSPNKKIWIDYSMVDKRLIYDMPMDVRVVINWSTDNSDIDLWIIDPYGEKTFYSKKISRIGGKISNDMTGGYGPEEFVIKEAVKGKYIIKIHYYGDSRQKAATPVTVQAKLFTNYSKAKQSEKSITLRLGKKERKITIGEFVY
jgi:tetratricopeptide (TPR) repeat protein